MTRDPPCPGRSGGRARCRASMGWRWAQDRPTGRPQGQRRVRSVWWSYGQVYSDRSEPAPPQGARQGTTPAEPWGDISGPRTHEARAKARTITTPGRSPSWRPPRPSPGPSDSGGVEETGGQPLLDDDPPVVLEHGADDPALPARRRTTPLEQQGGQVTVLVGDPAGLDRRRIAGGGRGAVDPFRKRPAIAATVHPSGHARGYRTPVRDAPSSPKGSIARKCNTRVAFSGDDVQASSCTSTTTRGPS
jgi:hypothetical protein